ncbi:MAG: heme-binding domain-containing protein, partial [Acidobacteria bacterium]|nr:heme-binding domain-containing protein [Acidobacteriota bacterium]
MNAIVVSGLAALATMAADRPVTFNRDVMPILRKSCQGCHHPGDIAPMSFLSYEETRPWAKSIRENVLKGMMPPWHADPRHGVFSNDRRLTREEIDTLVRWVDAGAPEGDPADLPPPVTFQEEWTIGKPDAVLPMTDEFTLYPKGQDQYHYFAIPTNFTEDRYIQAIEFRPGNRKVVHHGLVFLKRRGAPLRSRSNGDLERYNKRVGFPLFKVEGDVLRVDPAAPVHDDACGLPDGGSALPGDVSSGPSPLIHSFAPGSRGEVWPEGTGIKIPADSELMLQLHYVQSDTVEKDRSSVGLIFTKELPKQLIQQ